MDCSGVYWFNWIVQNFKICSFWFLLTWYETQNLFVFICYEVYKLKKLWNSENHHPVSGIKIRSQKESMFQFSRLNLSFSFAVLNVYSVLVAAIIFSFIEKTFSSFQCEKIGNDPILNFKKNSSLKPPAVAGSSEVIFRSLVEKWQ